MTQHTPVPWKLDGGHSSRVYLIDGKDGAVGELVFADTRNPADARLIAVAPELLKALQVMLRDYAAVHDIGDVEMQPAIYQARAAIAKATGGAA